MSKENKFYVYLHRRKTDGSVFYVGKGSGNRHSVVFGRNRHWHNVVSKHGYTSEIVMTFSNEACAFSLEVALIKFYSRKNLVNLTDGGEGSSNPSLETRSLMSVAKVGIPQSKKHAIKSRSAKIGFKVNDTSKFNLDKRKPIINSDGEIFESSIMAASVISSRIGVKASQGNISTCAMGGRNNAYGYSWSYDTSNIPDFVETVYQKKRIVCETNGMVFNSVQGARRWVSSFRGSANNQTISSCARGVTKTAYGHKWSYLDV